MSSECMMTSLCPSTREASLKLRMPLQSHLCLLMPVVCKVATCAHALSPEIAFVGNYRVNDSIDKFIRKSRGVFMKVHPPHFITTLDCTFEFFAMTVD